MQHLSHEHKTTAPCGASYLSYDQSPYLVLWELTRACALACRHCRADAIRQRDNRELSFQECQRVLDELARFDRLPLIVLTGGDPVWRPDLFQIIKEAKLRNFSVAITPSATPRTSKSIVDELKISGIARIAVSLDGPDADTHDKFRGVQGSFKWTHEIVNWAHQAQVPLQINTTIWKGNIDQFDNMAGKVKTLDPVLWSLFFLVPTGRAGQQMQIEAQEAEFILSKMVELADTSSYDLKATAAPHFRRVLLQQSDAVNDPDLEQLSSTMRLGSLRSYQSVNDGKGILFISHTGDIFPSGFLPLSAGNIRDDSLVEIYRHHPLFTALRDPELLRGKCGRCRYKSVCGGSRARAFARSGDYLAEDPLCSYIDPSLSA
ncbi:MAG: TIGR04053 family radical SAM/SPASM domain-containing protein [Candidatus Obscuribacterales bacterium]|nr:TIGR04053 family radical SAM/SPASM domain-containing protein [Cyanobacteria bacterium SZAS LIN-5]